MNSKSREEVLARETTSNGKRERELQREKERPNTTTNTVAERVAF